MSACWPVPHSHMVVVAEQRSCSVNPTGVGHAVSAERTGVVFLVHARSVAVAAIDGVTGERVEPE
jgi:hypothetical protein